MKKIFIFFLLLFFSACALKNQEYPSQKMKVVFNTPAIKINDFGFLKKENKALNLEVYKLGQAFFKLKIREDICLNSVCYSKTVFNQKFFKNTYYEDILKDILEAKPLWNSKNIEKTQRGFNQKLNSVNYEIFYEVCDNKISFFDKISHIKIILVKF
ncbi:hypothetical protein XJ74_04420 [Campylobacter coli]|uniref:Lipoprotein n=1 Tax=Campylobacter jejuni TaxID=197 RepID=A0A698FF74_CAMJU|nr:hypothetical protein [Campylobacter coli]EIP4520423.1 hypothetical protein [Campylobacter coli]MBT0864319.1 hypothetical protein [Campylobacter coli]